MKFTQTLFAVLVAGISSVSVSVSATDPPLPPWYPLEPWQISALHSSNPHASPYGVNSSSLVVTIANPKRIAAAPAPHASGGGYVVWLNSTARCELHWKTDAQTPYGYTGPIACAPEGGVTKDDYSYPYWTMTLNELHEDLSSPGDHYLSLSFELTHNATIYGAQAYKRMTGGLTFRAGTNLQGSCSAGPDGVCVFDIKDGSAPVLFQPTLQECKTACG